MLITNFNKFWILLFFYGSGIFASRAYADTVTQIKNAAEQKKYGIHFNTPRCNGDILVKIGALKFMVPRAASFIKLSGEEIKLDARHPLYNCELKYLSNIQRVNWGSLGLSAPTANFSTTESRYKKAIEDSEKNNSIKMLSSGLQEIDSKGVELYLFPRAVAQTKNNENVVFECTSMHVPETKFSGEECFSAYVHPSGINVQYHFYRKNNPVEQFTTVERSIRKRIEEMISNTSKAHEGDK